MTLPSLYLLLAAGTLVALVSVGAAKIAAKAGMPVLLAYLGVGLLLGEGGLGLPFDDAALAQALGLAALAVILVEGGLTTRLSDVRRVSRPACALATLGVFISVAVTAAAAHYLLGLQWQLALLLGAIVSSTDAAAVFSVLRAVPLPRRLSNLLEAESGLNDAPTFILVLAFSATSLTTLSPGGMLAQMSYQLVVGALAGVGVGMAAVWLLRRLTLPTSGLYPIATFACGVLAFAGSGLLQASGFIAAYLAGLVLGNAGLPHRRATESLAEGLGWIAQIGLFVMLGLLVSPADLPAAIVPALVVGAALLLIARPVSVLLTLLPFRIPLREQVFLSWAGLRGAVPIVLATVPVVAGTPGSIGRVQHRLRARRGVHRDPGAVAAVARPTPRPGPAPRRPGPAGGDRPAGQHRRRSHRRHHHRGFEAARHLPGRVAAAVPGGGPAGDPGRRRVRPRDGHPVADRRRTARPHHPGGT